MNNKYGAIAIDDEIEASSKNKYGAIPLNPETPEEREGALESITRYLTQIPQGILQSYTYPLDLLNMVATGSALDPSEIESLRYAAERQGIPFDEDAYLDAVNEISTHFPTQGNFTRIAEDATGIPLQAKTKGQKLLNVASMGSKLPGPGLMPQKGFSPAGAISAPSATAILEEAGVPEGISEGVGLGVAGIAGAMTPRASIGKETKPSGLTTRRYESRTKPTEISAKKLGKINQKVEDEFRSIADKIIEDTPVYDIRSALKEGPEFKIKASEAFEEVEKLAESLPQEFSSNDVSYALVNRFDQRQRSGFLPSESDKSYERFVKQFLEDTSAKKISAKDLVSQYRKNNKALSELFEPGQSKAYNRGKREALLDYNRSIADTIEKHFPDSEFSDMFKSTNDRWSKIMDAESIDKFLDSVFDKGIDFKKAKSLFEKEGVDRIFKRSMGEQGFKDFQQLMKDLLSTEQGHKLLRVAGQKGWEDVIKNVSAYTIHPNIGKAKLGLGMGKSMWKMAVHTLIDRPRLAVTWSEGIKAFKKGDFKTAAAKLNTIKDEVESAEHSNF